MRVGARSSATSAMASLQISARDASGGGDSWLRSSHDSNGLTSTARAWMRTSICAICRSQRSRSRGINCIFPGTRVMRTAGPPSAVSVVEPITRGAGMSLPSSFVRTAVSSGTARAIHCSHSLSGTHQRSTYSSRRPFRSTVNRWTIDVRPPVSRFHPTTRTLPPRVCPPMQATGRSVARQTGASAQSSGLRDPAIDQPSGDPHSSFFFQDDRPILRPHHDPRHSL